MGIFTGFVCDHKYYLDYIFENSQENHQEYVFKCMKCNAIKTQITYEKND